MVNTAIISMVIVSLLVISLLSNNAINSSAFRNPISTTSGFLTYYNSTYGIKIQFPSNWDLQEIRNALSDPSITIIRFTPSFDTNSSFDTDPSDRSTYIGINEQKDFKNMSLDSLMKNDINLINNDKNVSGFKLMSATTDSMLAGQKAYSLVYASTYNGHRCLRSL